VTDEGTTEMGVTELERRLENEDAPPFLLDVREPYEWQICNLGPQGATLIPMAEVLDRSDELPRDREIVVYCRSGGRSARIVKRLREAGFEGVYNLEGGILAWADEVDPSIQKY